MRLTHCPDCQTAFKVTPEQLGLAKGWVRCGRCSTVFEAAKHFEPSLAAETPVLEVPEPVTAVETRRLTALAQKAKQRAALPASDRSSASLTAAAPTSPSRPSATRTADAAVAADPKLPLGIDRLWGGMALLALLTLLLQGLHAQRDYWAAQSPALRNLGESWCEVWGCQLAWPADPQAWVIEGSSFTQDSDGSYWLKLRIRNQRQHPMATPALELSLLDAQEQIVIRRVFQSWDLSPEPVLPGLRELRTQIRFDVQSPQRERINGFRALIFYP